MLRSRAGKWMPHKKTAQIFSNSSYSVTTDPAWITRRDDGGPTESPWSGLKEGPNPGLSSIDLKIWSFYDNSDISLTDTWAQTKHASALVPALVDGRGGGMLLSTNTGTYNYLESINSPVVIGSNGSVILDVTFAIDNTGIPQVDFGFSDGLSFDSGMAFDNGVFIRLLGTGSDDILPYLIYHDAAGDNQSVALSTTPLDVDGDVYHNITLSMQVYNTSAGIIDSYQVFYDNENIAGGAFVPDYFETTRNTPLKVGIASSFENTALTVKNVILVQDDE